jgi:type III secretory pathway component EscS
MPEKDSQPAHQPARIIEQQDPAGIALFAAILCFVLAIIQGVTAYQTGFIPAELYLLLVLTVVFLAAWRFARKM